MWGPLNNAEGNSLVRHTILTLGSRAAGAAILSTTVAAFLLVTNTGAGTVATIGTDHGGPRVTPRGTSGHVNTGVLGADVQGRPAAVPSIGAGNSASHAPEAASAGSAVALRGVIVADAATVISPPWIGGTLTAALVGLLNRGGVPPTAYRAAEGGYDVTGTHDDQGNTDAGDVSWAELQPIAGGSIVANNAIDQAIVDVTAWNAANPGHHEGLKVRIVVGIHSPTWALNLGGQCFQVTDPNSGASGCCPRFWTTAFGSAYHQFEAMLAAKYDGNPVIGEVVMAKNTTVYNESLIRQTQSQPTVAALMAAGYTTIVDEQQQLQDIASMGTYWKHTHVGFAFNPYQTASPNTEDEAFTQQMITQGRATLGAQLILENNSLRQGYLAGSGNYQTMYTFMVQIGGPIAFQTSTLGRAGSLSAVLNGAIGLAAGSVELPSGYQTVLTPTQAAVISAGMA
jgi:hypothetical protein